jgi:parallel beta-helix repeat protein
VGSAIFLGNLISGNSFDGVFLGAVFGAAAVTNNLLEGNLIGTDVTGTKLLANAGNGVHLEGGAQGNTIGGTDPTLRNIISGNGGSSGTPAGAGVQIADLFGTGAVSGNVVEGNYIGTDITGSTATGSDGKALGNLGDGVIMQHGVTGNTVGGSIAGAGNVISGNTLNGVHITGTGTSGNMVQGNLIGTQADGTHALPNDADGVRIDTGASGNVIGGPAFVDDAGRLAGAGNVISGNGATNSFQPGISLANASANLIQGNFIGTDRTGTSAVANAGDGIDIDGGINNKIGGASSVDGRGNLTGLGNLISGSRGMGIAILSNAVLLGTEANQFATGNQIEGNFIGTEVTGSKPLPNQLDGVLIVAGARQNTVGGTTPGTRNIISGNGTANVTTDGAGVVVAALQIGHDENNLVENNYIGTDVTGLHALGNVNEGVIIQDGAQNNQVGAAGAGNLISGNPEGVIISGGAGNFVEANTIGLAADGSRLGNSDDGVRILDGANNNGVGTSGAGNIISGNAIGVYLAPSSGTAPAPANNLIQGNYIGTDSTGELARPNTTAGIVIAGGAANNQIGGAGQGNVIAANGSGAALTSAGYTGGVIITDQNTSGNVLEDNLIGADASGTQALGNTYAGVVIRNGASGNRIQRAQTGNVISANVAAPGPQGGFGVLITGSDTTNNVVTGNFIGTDRTATQALGGQVDGVEIANGANNDQVGAAGKPNVISGNTNAGVEFTGQNAGQNTFDDDVLGNLIGTDVTGTLPLGNGTNGTGVLVHHGAVNIVIGEFGAGNVISGNEGGVAVYDNPAGAIIDANYIGTDITGTKGVGNLVGIFVSSGGIADIGTPFGGIGTAGQGNVIADNLRYGIWFPGGSGSVFNNLISGNGGDGIHLGAFRPSDTQAVSIQGNLIGTGASATVPFPNKGYGIFIDHAHNVTVGGTDPGTANVVSGNTLGGIHVEGNDLPDGIISAWQMQDRGFGNPTDLLDTLARNTALAYKPAFVPYRFGQAVSLDGVSSYVRVPQDATLHPANLTVSAFVQFNALDTAGAALPGLEYILFQQNSRSSAFEGYSLQKLRVNGVDRFEFIVSSAGGQQVVAISKTAVVAGQLYHVAGSYDGTTVKLYVNGVLEGSQTAAFPLDYGNTDLYWGTSGQPSFDGKLSGLIGEVNIYGRALSDVEIASLAAYDGVSNNIIAGNSIGTDLHDTIPLGNGGDGIDIVNSSGNTIGATVTASNTVPATGGNFIDFNHGNGLLISGVLAQANQFTGNLIGTDMDGTADQGNLLAGVRFDTGANGNYLRMNRSSFNGRQGFVLEPDAGAGNALFDNSVTGNALGGIDLNDDGPSLNTPNSPHAGPNHMQNYPVIKSAAAAGGMTVIQVSLNSTPGRQFDLEFFANDSLDANGYAQGETVLTLGGNQTLYPVTTDSSGNATATVTFPSYLKGKYITATATDLTSADSSEFSAPVLVGTLAPVISVVMPNSQSEGQAQSISVSGMYFDSGAAVWLNGTPLATTFMPATQSLSAAVPAGATEEGVNIVTVVNPAPDAATSNAQSFTVNDAPLTIQAATQAAPLVATEGVPFSAAVVALFTDTGGLESLDDYSASIDWGDGSASNGVISFPSGGGALELGGHTYLEEGTYTVRTEVSDDGGQYAQTSETIKVGDAPLTPEPKANVPFIEAQSATAVVGQSATAVVGSFTDADPHGFAGLYSATINWGDPIVLPNGSLQQDITPGTVVADGAGFDVVGTHTYSQAHDVPNVPFNYPVTVTVTDATAGEPGGPNTITINSTAAVSPPPLVATGILPFAVVNGAVDSRVVANFTDPDGRTGPSNASKYSAVIDWGDGTPTSQGQIAVDGAGFKVTAPAHNYGPFPGTRSFTVTISDLVVNGQFTGQGRIVSVVDRVVDPPRRDKNGPFVYQVYEDLLGRAPTDGELSHWTGLMDHGTSARQIAAGLMRGLEYRTIEAQKAYHTYLQRDASAAELAAATHLLVAGGTVEQLQVQLVTSPEYWRLEGGTAAGFLDGLYQEALGHAPDAGVLAAAMRALHPDRVAGAVFASAEYRRDLVLNDYMRLLGEVPDQKTQQAYLGILAHGARDEDILDAIFGSADYRKWVS